ncbi:all-trans retinoic acid-induced differentiation factor isoform X2 [Sorex araneus]|uniref:all-trans retinoic acid-induced differentiation factor isoform X2 n=1 Tax=Sorex araneus TaxID=42254 RepID=UPI00243385E3|nr:all-trans retinoic acid-induced differentiation factor isoform X2 [Sorex araneus]
MPPYLWSRPGLGRCPRSRDQHRSRPAKAKETRVKAASGPRLPPDLPGVSRGRAKRVRSGPLLLDLRNCSLKDPGPRFPQALTAVIIDLQANPLEENLTDTFRGFTQLQTLVLPRDVKCPGGIKAWDNVTDGRENRTCLGQRNLCNDTRDPAMCPENGSCAPDGPGLLQCVCADGFHGYKCMRQGSFPLLMFSGILGSTTLAISAVLWGTQRRKAKAS